MVSRVVFYLFNRVPPYGKVGSNTQTSGDAEQERALTSWVAETKAVYL